MPTAQKAPSRRHLARVLSEAVPVVNEHADRLEYLKTHIDTADRRLAALETAQAEFRAMSFRQRLAWLVWG